MKKERILFLGGNYLPEPTGIGKYAGEMIDWLSNQGHECAVITTYPYYPHWKVQPPYDKRSSWYTLEERRLFDNIPIKVYRCPHYVPHKPSGLKRVLSDLSFFISAFLQFFIMLFGKKYDYVFTGAPPFQLGLLGVLYKWIRGARFVYHLYDLQVDAAKELGMIKSKPVLKMMFAIERFILNEADFVSSVSDGMVKKTEAKFNKPVIFFPNWADTKNFYPYLYKDELKIQFNFSPSDKVVLYSGAIGEKQGLEDLLQAAKNISLNNVKFLICGSGPYKEKLISLAQQMDLKNVFFLPLIPKEKFNEFLNMADLHLVLQKANADDLVMPSKLNTILAVGGLALVTATEGTSLHSIISKHEMGILVEPENPSALTNAIMNTIDQPYDTVKQNARTYAEEYLTGDRVLNRFFSKILLSEQPKEFVFTKEIKQIEIDTVPELSDQARVTIK